MTQKRSIQQKDELLSENAALSQQNQKQFHEGQIISSLGATGPADAPLSFWVALETCKRRTSHTKNTYLHRVKWTGGNC